jgi:aspartate racemase
LGGMGPLATSDMFQKIIQVTKAADDQSHVRVCIDSNTEIADRTAAILHGGKNPLPEMVKSAVGLQQMGADVLIMPCNTAHYFYEDIVSQIEIPFLHMLDETADAIARRGITRVGLLATDGTVQSGVYHRAFQKKGIEELIPDEQGQREVMHLTYDGIKAGNFSIDTVGFYQTARELMERGAELLVLGCTELPLAFQMYDFDLPYIDPTLVVASRAVQYVGTPVREDMRF